MYSNRGWDVEETSVTTARAEGPSGAGQIGPALELIHCTCGVVAELHRDEAAEPGVVAASVAGSAGSALRIRQPTDGLSGLGCNERRHKKPPRQVGALPGSLRGGQSRSRASGTVATTLRRGNTRTWLARPGLSVGHSR